MDALNRHTNLIFTSSSYEWDLENQILNAEKFDKEYQNLKEKSVEN